MLIFGQDIRWNGTRMEEVFALHLGTKVMLLLDVTPKLKYPRVPILLYI